MDDRLSVLLEKSSGPLVSKIASEAASRWSRIRYARHAAMVRAYSNFVILPEPYFMDSLPSRSTWAT